MESDLVRLLELSERLETLPRTGWLIAGIVPCESISSHGFQVALTTMWLCEHVDGVDTLRAIKMALLHDLGEAVLTDLPPSSKRLLSPLVLSAERTALKEVIGDAPPSWFEIWDAYASKECLESRVVKAADHIQMLSKALLYRKQRGADVRQFFEHRVTTGISEVDAVIDRLHERFAEEI